MESAAKQPGPMQSTETRALRDRLKVLATGLHPAIFRRRTREAELLQELGIRVLLWQDLKQGQNVGLGAYGNVGPSMGLQNHLLPQARPGSSRMPRNADPGVNPGLMPSIRPAPKVSSKAVKSKSNASGRKFTSRFRGVHQTFPTKRWEAQFRRNGKPTSLGCFDQEEQAAMAYDKMMIWCEMHKPAGVPQGKGGVTNFESSVYEDSLPWLRQCTQDELIDAMRSEGRRQAAQRLMKQKREMTQHATGTDEEPSGSVATVDA